MDRPKTLDRDGKLIEAALQQEQVETQAVTLSPLPPSTTLQPESIPDYDVVREIHRGGQGVVYEAVQHSTRRTVAVKVMLEGRFADERMRWRFEREVQLVASLKHPHIVAIHDSGLTHGRYFFAMDYVRGQPLDTHVRLEGPAPRKIVRLFLQVCEAVSYAHRHGIIHRDLKPSNILVGEGGDAQVLDFGLAKLMEPDPKESGQVLATMSGQIMGTLRYMSPEQTRGDQQAIDTRTDVYSLGVILYELLTGLPPYRTDGDIAEVMRSIREVDPPRPSRIRRDLRAELDAIILKAMHKEPDRRYATAEQLKDDLAAWLDGRPVSAKSDSSFYVLRKLAVKHYFHTSVITAMVASIIGFGGVSYHYMLTARDALRSQQESETSERRTYKDIGKFFADGTQGLRQQALGWFLLEWNARRPVRAREILADLKVDSPERLAMRYLLNDGVTRQQFEQAVPPQGAALLHFILGEQSLHNGQRDEALRHFEVAARSKVLSYEWFCRSARARLVEAGREVVPQTPDTQAAAREAP